jgi:hypothetical protein
VRVGAFDGLGAAEIAVLAAPGQSLLDALAKATAEVPDTSQRVAAAAPPPMMGSLVVACAGLSPGAAPLVVPGRVVPATVRAIAAGGLIGVVTPNAGQAPFAEAKWRADGFDVVVTHAAPSRADELTAAAARLRAADVTLVVLDCMGHDEASRAASRRLGPVVAVQPLIASSPARGVARGRSCPPESRAGSPHVKVDRCNTARPSSRRPSTCRPTRSPTSPAVPA